MASPVGSVKEHCEFLSTLRAVGGEQMSQEDFEAAVQKSLTIIKQALIATKSLKPPEAILRFSHCWVAQL